MENFDFYSKTLRGVKEIAPRWKRCVRYVDRDLGEAMGQEFVRRTFTTDTKEKTVDMTRRIETAMENEIKTLDWMTPATKQRALEKLHAVANKVGYPDRWRDYSALQIKRGDFYDKGRQFDAQGNLKDWWTPDDAKKFEERVQCVRDQYAQYTIVDDIKINSKLTSGEDVADLGGTLIAYIAWKDATANDNLQPMDGFTPDQRFFIGFAQWACENQRPENLRVNALTNPHSPGKYRINGIVSDLPDFARAFGCKAGQPMVNGKACRVW